MPNPYGITEVDVPGLLAGYEATQDRRVARLAQAAQARELDAKIAREKATTEAWGKFLGPQGGGVAGAYSQPEQPAEDYDPWDDDEAQNELISSLAQVDPKQAMEVRNYLRSHTKEEREQAAEAQKMIGNAAFQLRQLPPDQRPAALAQLVPMLRSLGADEAMIRQIDLSDQGLEFAVGQARDLEKLITGVTPDVQSVPGVGLFPVTPGSPYPDFSNGGARPAAEVGAGEMPRVSTPQEAMRLPPGSQFMLPDGRIGTVPGGASGNAGGGFPGY